MPTATRKKQILNTVAVSLGCSSSRSICRRPKLKFLFNLKPKLKKHQQDNYQKHPTHHRHHNSSCSSYGSREYGYEDSSGSGTAGTFSPNTDNSWDVEKVRGSVAVEKESEDPYLDFRQSMLQMILENEIYSKDDLKDLLDCFLQLNSPSHHHIIVRAFTEIWNGVFSVKTPPAAHPSSGYGQSSKLHCHQRLHREFK